MKPNLGGIYIHIPFCRQACRYCDFYFTVSHQFQDRFCASLLKEIEIRAAHQEGEEMQSLYFGGGTPSMLSVANLKSIIEKLKQYYRFSGDAEITIECNPDDLDKVKLSLLRELGFNRISLGIQSFHEEDLKLMRRSHNAGQAVDAVEDAASVGFDNITIDLIYGIPGQSLEGWKDNILKALDLPVKHISAYHLSFEEGTVFDHWRKKGRISPLPENESIMMFRLLRQELGEAGFEHYEISNFAKEGWWSRHNRLYWSGNAYLGFGPSAHSYKGSSRYWNVSSLKKYMNALEKGDIIEEEEVLSEKERYHDYLITSLRTKEGVDLQLLADHFGEEVLQHFTKRARLFVKEGQMMEKKERMAILPDSWLLADHIMRELFMK